VLIERGAQLQHIRGDGSLQEEQQVAESSGKALVEMQPALFTEMDEDKWRSTASVLPKNQQPNSSVR
jgi:hypothetical protein